MSILLTAKLAPKYTDSDREYAMRQRAEMLQQTQAKNLPFSREGLKRLRSPQQDKETQQRFLKSVGAPASAETYSGLPSNVMHVDLSDSKEYRQAIARMKSAKK